MFLQNQVKQLADTSRDMWLREHHEAMECWDVQDLITAILHLKEQVEARRMQGHWATVAGAFRYFDTLEMLFDATEGCLFLAEKISQKGFQLDRLQELAEYFETLHVAKEKFNVCRKSLQPVVSGTAMTLTRE